MAKATQAHQIRRAEFIAAAQKLFYSRGYDETPVSAILDHMGVAKGTFYHYFESKEDLLDQMVAQMTDDALIVLRKVLDEPQPSAIDQINRLFQALSTWKADHKEGSLMIMRALYSDENLLLRRKMFRRSVKLMTPILSGLIRRGIEEGQLTTRYPDETAELIMELGNVINTKVVAFVLSGQPFDYVYGQVEHWLTVYERKAEKMMGAPDQSVEMFNRADLKTLLS